MENDNPFASWNNPMYKDSPFAPHNNLMRRDDPREPWNNHFGSDKDLKESDRRAYGLRPNYNEEENY